MVFLQSGTGLTATVEIVNGRVEVTGDPSVVAVIRPLLSQSIRHERGEVRNGAITSVSRTARPGTEEHIEALCGHPDLAAHHIWPASGKIGATTIDDLRTPTAIDDSAVATPPYGPAKVISFEEARKKRDAKRE